MNKTNASTTLATTLLVAASLSLGYAILPKAQTARAASPASAQQTAAAANAQQRARAALAQVPVSFELNRGQFDPQVQFKSRGAGYTAFLTRTEAVFVLRNPQTLEEAASGGLTTENLAEKTRAERRTAVQTMKQEQAAARAAGKSVVRMSLVGANAAPQAVASDELPGKVNYFRGQDPGAWVTDVPTYGRVEFAGVYPGIDLVFYGKGRELEYDLVVAPGADAGQIALRFEGAERLEIDAMSGELVVHTPGGAQLRQGKPFVYQEVNGGRHAVSSGYAISGERVTFNVGRYDANAPLIIDP
jgi:hypothetical protein